MLKKTLASGDLPADMSQINMLKKTLASGDLPADMSHVPAEEDSLASADPPWVTSQLQHAEKTQWPVKTPPLQTKLYNPRQELERTAQFTKQTGLSMCSVNDKKQNINKTDQ